MNPFEELAVSEAKYTEPQRIFIIGAPKEGKSFIMQKLPKEDTLILDLEEHRRGYGAFECRSLSYGDEIKSYKDLDKFNAMAYKYYEENNKTPKYKFLVVDLVDTIEKMAVRKATIRRTKLNSGYFNKWTEEECITNPNLSLKDKGKTKPTSQWISIIDLPHGRGWGLMKSEFMNMIGAFQYWAEKIIYVSHIRISRIGEQGEGIELLSTLSGSLSAQLAGHCDATALVERGEQDGKSTVFFNFDIQERVEEESYRNFFGSAYEYLNGRKIPMSVETDESGVYETHWEEIFPSLKEE